VISTSWANPTLSDIAAELTNSLDRQGRGGMLAPFKFADGTLLAPSMAFTSEPTAGFYRAGTSDVRIGIAGIGRMRWTATGVDVYDQVAGTWLALTSTSGANFAFLDANNAFVAAGNTFPALKIGSGVGVAGANSLLVNSIAGLAPSVQIIQDTVGTWSLGMAASSAAFDFGFNSTRQLRLNTAGLQVGTNNYAVVNGSSRYIGLTSTAGQLSEIGVFANDGTNNPSVALFADPTSGQGVIGVGYAGANDPIFEFRSQGAGVFQYTDVGVTVANGLYLRAFTTGGVRASMVGLDSGNVAHFGSDTLLTSYIFGSRNAGAGTTLRFRTADVDRMTITDSGITFNLPITFGAITATTITGTVITASTRFQGPIGSTSPNTGAFTTLSASGTVSGAGFSTYLAAPPAIGTTTPAGGRFTFAHTAPVAVAFNATTMTVDCNLSNVFTTTFTANVTTAPTISNPKDGQTINWFITQDGAGGRTIVWPTTFRWPGGTDGVLSTGANAVDLLVATYRATPGAWYCTLTKNFLA
jgi:hypothetical protein